MSDGTPGPLRPTPKRDENQPTAAVPVERKPGSMSKRLRNTLVVIGALVVVATVSALFGFWVLADKAEKENTEAVGSVDCTYISDVDMSAVVGTPVDAFQFGRADGGIAEQVTDSRVSIDGATCLAAGQSSDLKVSFIVADDDAAEQTFADQKALAEVPANAATPYLQSVEPGIGDDAFCTTPDGSGYSGVLVREGDRLVYVSVIPADPDATAEARCGLAKQIASALL
jgi:hypothetical protein